MSAPFESILWGIGVFMACWLVHLLAWRIRRPDAYLFWLPLIFMGLPLLGCMGWLVFGNGSIGFERLAETAILHLGLSVCYILQYAGIVEYSPSAEVLKFVRSRMPRGVPVAEVDAPTLSEYALTTKRIEHLLGTRCAVQGPDGIALSARGSFAIRVSVIYRRILGLSDYGEG